MLKNDQKFKSEVRPLRGNRFSSVTKLSQYQNWRQNQTLTTAQASGVSRYFLADKGAGSGVHNRVVFENSFNTRALNLVRASIQGGVITDAAQTGLNFTGDFTVESYGKLTTNTNSMDLISKWNGTGNQRSYIVRLSPASNLVELYISPDGATVTAAAISYTFPTAGTSFHIAVGYDASAGLMKLEVNGVLINTAAGNLATSIFDSTADVTVGYLTGGTNAFNGVLDHYRVWSEYRSTADILANMNVSIVTDATNLVANWKFNGNMLDSSSNNNNLTAFNAPTYVAPLFGSNIYLSGDCAIVWQGFISDQEEGSYGLCGADEEVAYGQVKFADNTVVIKTETDQTAADTIDISGVNVEDSDGALKIFILERSSDVWSLYINGTVVGNTATVAGVLNIQQFLGSPEDTADLGYDGGMKNFKVYSAALSAGEKTTINAGGHVSTNCVYWANTDATTTAISDLSGSGRTGTLANNGANFFFSYLGENLFTSSGFSAWGGAFPNELPTNWATSGSRTTVNYLTEKAGKVRLNSDGTNLGFAKNAILVEGQRYKALLNVKAIYAMTILTSNATNPSNLETVTLGSTVYTFKSVLVSAFDVLIGANAAATLDNLKSAVNKTAGEGTTYGTGTTIHPTVEATDNTDTTQTFVAKSPGAAGATIASTETSATLSFSAATLGLGSVYFFNQSGNTSITVGVITIGEGWNVWPFTAGATLNLSILRLSGLPNDNVLISQCLLYKY